MLIAPAAAGQSSTPLWKLKAWPRSQTKSSFGKPGAVYRACLCQIHPPRQWHHARQDGRCHRRTAETLATAPRICGELLKQEAGIQDGIYRYCVSPLPPRPAPPLSPPSAPPALLPFRSSQAMSSAGQPARSAAAIRSWLRALVPPKSPLRSSTPWDCTISRSRRGTPTILGSSLPSAFNCAVSPHSSASAGVTARRVATAAEKISFIARPPQEHLWLN